MGGDPVTLKTWAILILASLPWLLLGVAAYLTTTGSELTPAPQQDADRWNACNQRIVDNIANPPACLTGGQR